MIRDLGIVQPGTLLYIPFHTFDSNDPSASVTLSGLATTDIEVFKDGSVTQRASDNGYALLDTDGIDFDGVTGIHGISIDLADNSTAGFYSAGSQYWVVISSVTVDAATVNFVLCTFRIGQPAAILNTTIASLSSQTSFTLTVGPAEDDALNGCMVRIHDVASAVQSGFAIVSDYTGSTKTVTLAAGTTFTAAATDNISFFPPALQPTVAGRTLDVSAGGEAGVDWANVGTPGSTVSLSATTVATVTTTGTATAVTTVNGLAANVITAASIATGAIDADAIADNAIDAGAIASDAITAAKIATGAITSAKFAAGAIDAAAIANNAIDAATFAADVDAEILSYIVDDATRVDASALNTLSSHDPGATLGTSTLTQTQVSGGAYALNSASFAFNAALDFTTAQKAATLARVTLVDAATVVNGFSAAALAQFVITDTLQLTGNVINGSVIALTLDSMFRRDMALTSADVVSGSVMGELSAYAWTVEPARVLTAATNIDGAIADAVWDEALAGHLSAGSTGEALNAAGAAGDPWTTTLPGAYTGSQAGKILADVVVDTAEIGAAGAGLTNINLPNQTMDIVGNITGNLSGSVGSVTGAVGSVTGAVASVTGAVGSVTGNVGGNVAGSVGSVTGNVGGIAGTITTLDALDTAQDTQHSTTQTAIGAISTTIGAAGAGLTVLATQSSVNAIDDFLDTEITTLTTELAKVPKSDGSSTWNATALASLQSEATDALNAYDPPTRAELTTDINSVLAQLPAAPVKNSAFTYVVKMVDATDGMTPETGLTITVTRSIDGAAFASATGAVTEISTGHYKFIASAADMNGDFVTHRFTASGAQDLTLGFLTVS